jgi:RimJ/RimL family protein N-acetyltransferase
MVEGARREAELRDGEWVDEVLMGLLDREWSAHRGYPEADVSSTAR